MSVFHPFDRWRKGWWQEEPLVDIVSLVDAIEVHNSRCMSAACSRFAFDFARLHGVPGTVGSDAHTAWEPGRATLLLPAFSSADELRRVIREGAPRTHQLPPWIHLASRFASLSKRINPRLDTS